MVGFRREISHLVSVAIEGAPCDRYELAAMMSRLADKEVSKAMLDGWSAESREAFNLPFYLVPAFEEACVTHALGNWLAEKRGSRLLIGKEALTAELGKLEQARNDASQKIKELKKIMGAHP